MSIFTGKMRSHLEGHKDLTNHEPVLKLPKTDKVYLPLINMNSTTVEVLVKPGDKVYVGTKVAQRNDHFIVPIYSSVSGKVVGIEKRMHACLKIVDHLVIENDGKYEAKYDLKPIDWEKATNNELVDFMMNAGIVGCGGAGFPAYIKYKAAGINTLIINGVECEPYITADYKAMMADTADLVTGIKILKKMSGAKEVMIAIKEDKKDLIAKVEEGIKGIEAVSVKPVPDLYPMGWERTVVYQLLHKRYDKLPSEVGVIVQNATTVISFAQAVTKGKPIVEKIVTFSGDGLKKNANVLVPVGKPVKEIIDELGGYASDSVVVIAGGPMMGKTVVKDEFVIGTYSDAITVLKYQDQEALACLRCGRCSEACPAGLQPVRINNAFKSKDIELIRLLGASQCIECGSCTYVCPSNIAVTEGIRQAKTLLALHPLKKPEEKGGKK